MQHDQNTANRIAGIVAANKADGQLPVIFNGRVPRFIGHAPAVPTAQAQTWINALLIGECLTATYISQHNSAAGRCFICHG